MLKTESKAEVLTMNKIKARFSGWYWRTLFVAMTIAALVAAVAAPDNWS